jgi:hypothetical protein
MLDYSKYKRTTKISYISHISTNRLLVLLLLQLEYSNTAALQLKEILLHFYFVSSSKSTHMDSFRVYSNANPRANIKPYSVAFGPLPYTCRKDTSNTYSHYLVYSITSYTTSGPQRQKSIFIVLFF